VSAGAIERLLRRHRKVGIDTSVFIYQVEESAKYVEPVDRIFAWLEVPSNSAATSTITMLELLVQPYQQSDVHRVNKFYALLSTYPNLEWIPPTLDIADSAARLRAEHRLKIPDALQAATALAAQATAFVTNDAVFRRLPGLEVLILDEILVTS
jgi:predicted nucleic acid-binding protein